ncbi:MAG: PIN domain-containing protein [Okeania sp. SIO2C9]|uniref:type II toxin-antitoxin system VapC family toxin n=1 Tax=Okeania sp. SIO2C9 TaxID=2607791 RepID=UPI0013C16CDD|nr:PIN domain-containing protein [Okeania sp. SIO2C9]NEQ75822.1 PIN domain-containing protein [Okeania sp. SIO2C9]
MNLIKTYIDSGVLIQASRGDTSIGIKAQEILDDPQREYATSSFVKLEVLPKAIYNKQLAEVNFYETFFAGCTIWANELEKIVEYAQKLASDFGINAIDALHVAAAISVNADELITTEKPNKPMHRVTQIKVTSIYQ